MKQRKPSYFQKFALLATGVLLGIGLGIFDLLYFPILHSYIYALNPTALLVIIVVLVAIGATTDSY